MNVPMKSQPRYQGLRLTAEEFFTIPDDGYLYELINGVVVMSLTPSFLHQRALSRLFWMIADHVERHQLGTVVVAPFNVQLGQTIVYHPDIVFFSPERFKLRLERQNVIPDLIVEIVSESTAARDLSTRKEDYESAKVEEYWAIDPENRQSRFFVLRGGKYRESQSEEFRSPMLKGMRFDSRSFFEALSVEFSSTSEAG